MEYADDGDLFQKICEHKKKRVYIEERKVWKYAIQVCEVHARCSWASKLCTT